MSNQRWKAKWKADDIAFHQTEVNPHLTEFWSHLDLDAGATVLVPLCGKSHDLSWLQQQGYRVIGIELSHIAIAAFFAGRGEQPQRQRLGRFNRWWYGDIEIWCGDLFDLRAHELGHIAAIYDCAALTALPATSRSHYVRQLSSLLGAAGQMLLLTTESSDADDQAEDDQTPDQEVLALYQSRYAVELLHGQSCMRMDPEFPALPASLLAEKVYHMGPLV
jgi:thiopurine S-methyltransferase